MPHNKILQLTLPHGGWGGPTSSCHGKPHCRSIGKAAVNGHSRHTKNIYNQSGLDSQVWQARCQVKRDGGQPESSLGHLNSSHITPSWMMPSTTASLGTKGACDSVSFAYNLRKMSRVGFFPPKRHGLNASGKAMEYRFSVSC